MVDRMSRHMLANPVLARAATAPRVIVDSACFENRSSHRLDKNILIDRLATRLQIAANEHTRFVDREHADMIEKEPAFKREGIADIGTGGLTQAVAGADYRLTGRIALPDARAPFGARRPERRLRRRHMQPCDHRSTDGSASSPARSPAGAGDIVGAGRLRKTAREARPRSTTSREGKMFRYPNALLAVVALGALVGLSGCLGGGGGGSTAAPAAQMPSEPAPAPAPRARAEPTPEPEPAPAPRAAPKSGWQAVDLWQQASVSAQFNLVRPHNIGASGLTDSGRISLGKTTRGSSPSVSPLSDGSGVRVSAVSSVEHFGDQSPVTFDSRGGPVFEVGTKEALLGRVAWDDGDDDEGRWTAWGWWVALRGVDFLESAPDPAPILEGASGVFADGPEFREAPGSLPETGTGRYRGTATGVFRASNHADASFHPGRGFGAARRSGAGEFTASVDLVMNYGVQVPNPFDQRAITADMRVVRMDGTWWRNTVTVEEFGSRVRTTPEKIVQEFGASGGPAWVMKGTIYREPRQRSRISYGTFSSDSMKPDDVSGVGPGIHRTTGTMAGRLSNVPGAGGHPRSALGVFGVDLEGHGTFFNFSGAFLAPLVE